MTVLNNYNYQKSGNLQALLEDPEYKERKEVLKKIVPALERNNVRWGLACSTNLFLRGIVDEFHDFDLIIDGEDVEKSHVAMKEIGAILIETGGNGFCESDTYEHYQLGRVDIDIISGFRVKTFGMEYVYKYNYREIENYKIYDTTSLEIPLISAEALYILYYMMEGWQAKRRFKRELLQTYIECRGVFFKGFFEQALTENIPITIKMDIRELLEGAR